MKIFTEIKNSIYNKEYYSTIVLNQPLRKSVKYLAKLSLLAALLGVIVFAFSIPSLYVSVKKGVSSISSDYPDDLVVSLKDGNVNINKPEPYMVKVPENLIDSKDSAPLKIDNLLVINTSEPFSLDKFREYSTFSLMTKRELIVMQSERGEVRILPLSDFGNIEITKALVLEKEALVNKILPWVMAALVPLLYIVIFIGLFSGTLVILFFYAAIVWLVLKIKGIKVSYKTSYQVALHASTILLVLSVFNPYMGRFDNFFVRSLILIIIVYINFDNNFNPEVKEESQLEIKNE